MTKKNAPSGVVPESVTSTTFGCEIFEAARASRRRRSTRSGVWLYAGWRIFSATRLPMSMCSAS